LDFWLYVALPIFIGAFGIAGGEVVRRLMMLKKKGEPNQISPLQFCLVRFWSATAIYLAVYLVTHWLVGGSFIPEIQPAMWNGVALTALANAIMQWLGPVTARLPKADVNLTSPLTAMTPGLVTGFAILLGEYPGVWGVAGIGLTMVGSWVLLFKEKPQHWTEYFGPVVKLTLLFPWANMSEDDRQTSKVVRLALTSATLGVFGLVGEALFVRRGGSFKALVLGATAVSGMMAIGYNAIYILKPDTKDSIWTALRRRPELPGFGILPTMLVLGVFTGVMWNLNMLTVLTAFAYTYVANVGALKRISIPIALLLGLWLFREQYFKQRMLATAIIIAGAVLISFDGLPARLSERIVGLGF